MAYTKARADWIDYRQRLLDNTPEHYRQRLAECAAARQMLALCREPEPEPPASGPRGKGRPPA